MSITISQQGAQIYSWNQSHFGEILWVSHAAIFQKGKSIRGGIPICWPWFGPKEGKPQHGFCRTMDWQNVAMNTLENGDRFEKYFIQSDALTLPFFEYKFELTLEITYGNELKLALTTKNTDDVSFMITEALHTYFLIGDIKQILINGLDNCTYFDKVNKMEKVQKGSIIIQDEIDNVYENQNEVAIIDPVLGRKITISHHNANNTVVWNPGPEKAKNINDMKPDEYNNFVCVESANALKNEIVIDSGAKHTITQIIKVDLHH